MKTKFSLFLVVLFLLPEICFGGQLWVKPDGTAISSPKVDEDGNLITRDHSQAVGWSILQSRTTEAFTLSLTSSPASGIITGRETMYNSSTTLEVLNSLGAAATYYFDRTAATCDTLNEFISSMTASGWTATLSQGCYGYQASYVARLGTAAVNNEGYIAGVQNSDDTNGSGKVLTVSTGTANAKKVYLNGTQYIAYRVSPTSGKSIYLAWLDGNPTLATTGTATITAYEGSTAITCTTQLNTPISVSATATRAVGNYPDGYAIIGTDSYAQEYVLYGSTYITGGTIGAGGRTE